MDPSDEILGFDTDMIGWMQAAQAADDSSAHDGVYRSRRQKKADNVKTLLGNAPNRIHGTLNEPLDEDEEPDVTEPAKRWPTKKPAGNAPRQFEANDVTCSGFNPLGEPGCYFPYSLPTQNASGEKIKWNAVSFNPRSGESSPEFDNLDPMGKALMHISRAASRLGSANGIWRIAEKQPFKVAQPEDLRRFFALVLNEARRQTSQETEPLIVSLDADAKFDEVMDRCGRFGIGNDLAMPLVMAWNEKQTQLQDPQLQKTWQRTMLNNAARIIRSPDFEWKITVHEADATFPEVHDYSWRDGEGIVHKSDGEDSIKFRTQYAQSWNYFDLGMRHIYEAARQLAIVGEQLKENGPDSKNVMLRRMALLPEDIRLLFMTFFIFKLFLDCEIKPNVPSWRLVYSPVDAISRKLLYDFKYIPDDANAEVFNQVKPVALHDGKGGTILYSRPVMAMYIINLLLQCTPKSKERKRMRETYWKDLKKVADFASSVEAFLRGDLSENIDTAFFGAWVDHFTFHPADQAGALPHLNVQRRTAAPPEPPTPDDEDDLVRRRPRDRQQQQQQASDEDDLVRRRPRDRQQQESDEDFQRFLDTVAAGESVEAPEDQELEQFLDTVAAGGFVDAPPEFAAESGNDDTLQNTVELLGI